MTASALPRISIESQSVAPADPVVGSHGICFYTSSPRPSTHANPIWERLVQQPQRTIDLKQVAKVHTLINKGIDKTRFGHTRHRIEKTSGEEIIQKAAWRCKSTTYDVNTIERGKQQRSYTKALHAEHLSGAATDFFCGAMPSECQSHWQWALLDSDVKNDRFPELEALVAKIFPELIPETSTSGRGVHRMIRINYYGKYVPAGDQEMHNLVVSWCGRLKRATEALFGSFLELKGACCYWNKSQRTWTLGTLGRLPRLRAEQLSSIPIFSQAEIEKRIEKIEKIAGIQPIQPSVCSAPALSCSSSVPQGETSPHTPADTGYASSDAFQRMIHAKCQYIKQHKALPADEEALCDYYESLNLQTGDRTPERLCRAQRVLDYARKNWRTGGGTKVECGPEALRERQKMVSEYITVESIKAARSKGNRTTASTLEIAAYQLIAIELNHVDDFSGRDKIMEVMNEWHEQGHLPRAIGKHKMAILRKLCLNHSLLVLTVKPCVATRTASSYQEATPSASPALSCFLFRPSR
jgi:hypothetical protein